ETATPVKAVVVTMYEKGEPTGDDPGELQLWVERSDIKTRHDFPLGEFPIFQTMEDVLIVCVGGGIPNATASIMALGADQRFDLSKSYWLIAGIAGGDPLDVSLGSAVWARNIIDGDLAYEIDAREIEEDWPYGYLPLGASRPAEKPEDIYTGWTLNTISFPLNEGLTLWAYEQSKSVELPDFPASKAFREAFEGYPNAQQPPSITIGETLSASTYWHGEKLNEWANDWVQLYSDSTRNFMTSNMEDSGTLTALYRLSRTDQIDPDRILVLRTVSNYTTPPEGQPATWSATAPYPDEGRPAFEAAYLVGSKVIDQLVAQWEETRDQIPSGL
ncbi:MAG: purine nucleoside permease, partial [Bacteroidota bacterium]